VSISFFLAIEALRPITMRIAVCDRDFSGWISFTRLVFCPSVKLSCDWCSLLNGYINFVIYHHSQNTQPFSREEEQLMVEQLQSSSFLNVSVPSQIPNGISAICERINAHPTHSIEHALHRLQADLESIEKVWCPFKYMKDVGQREDKYHNWLDASDVNIIKFGRMLWGRDIDCKDCIPLANLSLPEIQHSPNDFFDSAVVLEFVKKIAFCDEL